MVTVVIGSHGNQGGADMVPIVCLYKSNQSNYCSQGHLSNQGNL